MDFFTEQVKKKLSDKKPNKSEPNHHNNNPGPTGPSHKPVSTTQHRPATNAELMASAKIVAEAAQAAARHETAKLDKAKVAGATADILDAASRYGKLDEKSGVGQYLEKAEQYLHKYESSHAHASAFGYGDGSHGGSGGGFGDYAKMAQGFMK
ncbi:unnamed protein product [Cochlearia groenlandica]